MTTEPKASGIVSLRLTPEERKLVEEAAAKKNWKTAHFLRVSALERAAHTLNLARPTSFDFGGVARRLAEALMADRQVEVWTNVQERLGRFGVGNIPLGPDYPDHGAIDLSELEFRRISPEPLAKEEMEKVVEAVRLGGLEFAEQLLIECRRMIRDVNDPTLPAPIDPVNLQKEVEPR